MALDLTCDRLSVRDRRAKRHNVANSALDKTDCRLQRQPDNLLTQQRKGSQRRSTPSPMWIPAAVFFGRRPRYVPLVDY